jgi:hypothetical protein
MALFKTTADNFDYQSKSGGVAVANQNEIAMLSSRFALMRDAIGTIEQGKSIVFISAGSWALHDLLRYVLMQTGPADVDAFTWSISVPGATQIINLLESGQIREFSFIAHMMMKKWSAAATQMLKTHTKRLHLSHIHAKGFILRNENWQISCISSANYTNNPAIEGGIISTSPEVWEQNRKWIDAIHENGANLDEAFTGLDGTKSREKSTQTARNGVLLLLRGLPGAGKTELARILGGEAFENDDYFTIGDQYLFDAKRMHQAVASCLQNVKNAMEERKPLICVANPFVEDRDMAPYQRLAALHGYRVHIVTVENRHGGRNRHGVTATQIAAMRQNYEVKL